MSELEEKPNLAPMIRATIGCYEAQEVALSQLVRHLNRMEFEAGDQDKRMLRARIEVALAERDVMRARIAAAKVVL